MRVAWGGACARGSQQPVPVGLGAPDPLLQLCHPSFPPQPLHNWHDEPGYLFYSQPAASSQLQVRCPFSSTCYLPGRMLIFPSLVHWTLTKASSH